MTTRLTGSQKRFTLLRAAFSPHGAEGSLARAPQGGFRCSVILGKRGEVLLTYGNLIYDGRQDLDVRWNVFIFVPGRPNDVSEDDLINFAESFMHKYELY